MPAEAARDRRAGVIRPTFTPPAERRSVLDRAHVGDIEGALGTVIAFDTGPRRSLPRRLATLLAIMGPGLVVLIANNDAGGLSIYAQAGQNYGASLLWVLVLLAPVLFINQEMVARLGAVTGAGHARLILERFGRRWGAFAISDLLALGALTIVTELIGVTLALGYFGVGRYVAVPLAAIVVIGLVMTGSFRRWERAMYALIALSALVFPLAVVCFRPGHAAALSGLRPDVAGGLSPGALLLILALAGTTVAPWQLFLQQSNVIDKRITPRWLGYERADTVISTALMIAAAAAVMLACGWAFGGSSLHGSFENAGAVATGLRARIAPVAGDLFAIVLLDASLLGAAAVTLASSYAVGDYFGFKHSLHRSWRDARAFHATYALFIGVAAAVVLLPGAPLGLITTGVQALAGILLPSATVFLVLLCNDRAVLGPWVNPRWLNAIAATIIGILIVLSAVLTATTLFPHVDIVVLAVTLLALLCVALLGAGLYTRAGGGRQREPAPGAVSRRYWTMPPLEQLEPPELSRARTVGLLALRVYLGLATAMLIVKAIELGITH